jgi:hypothetical protein
MCEYYIVAHNTGSSYEKSRTEQQRVRKAISLPAGGCVHIAGGDHLFITA